MPEYTENLIVDHNTLLFIRERIRTGSKKLESDTVWAEEGRWTLLCPTRAFIHAHTEAVSSRWAESPILTMKAMRETAHLGTRHKRYTCATSGPFVERFGIKRAEEEQIEEPQVDLEETLYALTPNQSCFALTVR